MDSEILAAAILSAGFAVAQRQSLHAGSLDREVREKFVEYYVFICEQTGRVRFGKGKKKKSRVR